MVLDGLKTHQTNKYICNFICFVLKKQIHKFLTIKFSEKKGRGRSRGRVQGVRTPPEMTCGFLIQLVFWKKKNKKTCGYIVSQLRHSLVVHPLLKKILDPPLKGGTNPYFSFSKSRCTKPLKLKSSTSC